MKLVNLCVIYNFNFMCCEFMYVCYKTQSLTFCKHITSPVKYKAHCIVKES